MEKYKQYIDVQWWNGINKRDVENWIGNFGANKEMAELILNNVIFYNVPQMKAYTRYLINKFKENVYMQTLREKEYTYVEDEVLHKEWDEYMSETNFLPAAMQSDPTSSAHKIIGYWRSEVGKGSECFSVISDIEKSYNNGIRRFILVDDFSGSGEQMLSVLRQSVVFQGESIELGKLPDVVKDIEVIVALYVIHEKSKSALHSNYPNILVNYVDLISDDLNFLNENALIYEQTDTNKRKQFIDEIKKLSESIMACNTELQELSTYVLNIPVVFEHGCPNNTLLLLFAHANNWQQLFKRGKEV